MYVCYLDDSDNDNGPVTVIAGYYTTADKWMLFERHSEAFLKKFNVTTLRGKDFKNGHGCFKNWSRQKKERFVNDLYSLARYFIIEGVSSSVRKKDFLSITKARPGFESMSALGIAFGNTITGIVVKSPEWREILRSKISFIVESGNKNNSNLETYF